MRDYKLNVVEEGQGVDIDIINGEPAYLAYEDQTYDQRAAIAAYTVKGTVPGARDYGVAWTDQYTQNNTAMQLSNDVQQMVQQESAPSGDGGANYSCMVINNGGSLGAIITRG